ncbi:hypothetical protein niasHS_001544 [Heterodera schachtii]|uniref:Uncharacterized protein n=1 Tax=Heterodera schachtii TaxID=97005 RepID=A0ABD2KDR3_HETSC
MTHRPSSNGEQNLQNEHHHHHHQQQLSDNVMNVPPPAAVRACRNGQGMPSGEVRRFDQRPPRPISRRSLAMLKVRAARGDAAFPFVCPPGVYRR